MGWAAVAGGGTIAGIGFTVSLLIATLAFSGRDLEEAKLGILTAALGAAGLTWVLFRITAALPPARRARALLGTAESIVDLADPVDPDRDHIRGPSEAPVTLVEYADFECPYCGQAEPIVRELLADFGDIRYVWRHLPLRDVHPHAQFAAEAAEAAARQGAFWEMHDLLLDHQGALLTPDLVGYAEQLGLDVARFTNDLHHHAGAAGSPRTSTAPISAGSRAPRPSSSTADATTAPTTSRPCPTPSASREPRPRSRQWYRERTRAISRVDPSGFASSALPNTSGALT